MEWFLDRTVSFFVENSPSLQAVVIGGPLSFLWAYGWLLIAGRLKKTKGFRTGYTRKIFHFAIFLSVAVIQWIWGTPAVCLFGGITSVVIFYAILRGSGNILYEAIAREKDAPLQTHYIIVPYFATLFGGLISNILFGPIAVVGYLVTGLGDAVGEPVGVKYGKHIYTVPSLTKVRAIRSWEGSAAVFFMSLIAVFISIALSPELSFTGLSIFTVPLLALACASVEAVSPHGWDNMTMQIIPSLLVYFKL